MLGTIAARQHPEPAAFDEISEAFGLIYEEADRFGLFDVDEIERTHEGSYESSGVGLLIDKPPRSPSPTMSVAAHAPTRQQPTGLASPAESQPIEPDANVET